MLKKIPFLGGIIFLLMATILVSSSGCHTGTAANDMDQEEEAEIYAAVVRQLVTVDDTFGGDLKPAKIFIIRNTDDNAGNPTGGKSLSVTISQTLQDKISRALGDLPADIVWIDKFENAEFEKAQIEGLEDLPMQMVKDGGAIITLGNIDIQNNSTVHLSGSIYVANLAAGGTTYILEKQDGVWAITGTTGVHWIS